MSDHASNDPRFLPYNMSNPHMRKFADSILSGFKQWFWLLFKLPAAWFMGVTLRKLDHERAEVTLPYRWSSQNPFRSTYFAAQAAAAEFSTGVLAMMAIQGRGEISMLVAGLEGKFTKKAVSTTTFTCLDAPKFFEAVAKAIETGEGQTVIAESVGVQADGTEVSRFKFAWSFKTKKKA